ncbi:hypothetical protein FGG08_007409 [Glutinoglossum americanum]|uniref:Uncharacterized protein n=1 Tax=Glutinoglossum americanum TaxID=1670608 RepID=A0A9P8HQV2_9PEZI|nr:hypothetical protein FGG08_007409 [Glutinoglossum americanum]
MTRLWHSCPTHVHKSEGERRKRGVQVVIHLQQRVISRKGPFTDINATRPSIYPPNEESNDALLRYGEGGPAQPSVTNNRVETAILQRDSFGPLLSIGQDGSRKVEEQEPSDTIEEECIPQLSEIHINLYRSSKSAISSSFTSEALNPGFLEEFKTRVEEMMRVSQSMVKILNRFFPPYTSTARSCGLGGGSIWTEIPP